METGNRARHRPATLTPEATIVPIRNARVRWPPAPTSCGNRTPFGEIGSLGLAANCCLMTGTALAGRAAGGTLFASTSGNPNEVAMKRLTAVLAIPLLLPAASAAPPGARPPKAAIEACLQSEEAETCDFELNGEVRTGVCMPGPKPQLPLACRPDDREEDGEARRRPPAAAFSVCEEKTLESECSFSHEERTIEGTCVVDPEDDTRAVCRPQHPGPRREGGAPRR